MVDQMNLILLTMRAIVKNKIEISSRDDPICRRDVLFQNSHQNESSQLEDILKAETEELIIWKPPGKGEIDFIIPSTDTPHASLKNFPSIRKRSKPLFRAFPQGGKIPVSSVTCLWRNIPRAGVKREKIPQGRDGLKGPYSKTVPRVCRTASGFLSYPSLWKGRHKLKECYCDLLLLWPRFIRKGNSWLLVKNTTSEKGLFSFIWVIFIFKNCNSIEMHMPGHPGFHSLYY